MLGQIEAASAGTRALRPRPDAQGLAFVGQIKATEQGLARRAEAQGERLRAEQLQQKRPEALFGRSIAQLSSAADAAAQREAQEASSRAQRGFMLEEQQGAAQRSLEEGAAMQREGAPPAQQEYAKVLGALQAVAAKAGGKQQWGTGG